MRYHVRQVIVSGNVVSNIREDISDADTANLRNAVQQALTDLQTIQGAALTTEAAQIQAIKQEALILEKLIRYIARKVS